MVRCPGERGGEPCTAYPGGAGVSLFSSAAGSRCRGTCGGERPMTRRTPAVAADPRAAPGRAPLSVWTTPLKANVGGLFKSLAKAAGKAASLQWAGSLDSAIDAISCVGFEQDPGRVTWVLLHRAMTRAVFDLLRE